MFFQRFEMKRDGLSHQAQRLLFRVAHRRAAWQIRHVRAHTGIASFDHNEVIHSSFPFSPAALSIALSVPGGNRYQGYDWRGVLNRAPARVGASGVRAGV